MVIRQQERFVFRLHQSLMIPVFQVSSARLKINFPLDAFGKSVDSLAILPPGEIDEKSLAQNIRRSFSRLNVSVNTELTKMRDLERIVPSSVQLQKSAGVQLRLQSHWVTSRGFSLKVLMVYIG